MTGDQGMTGGRRAVASAGRAARGPASGGIEPPSAGRRPLGRLGARFERVCGVRVRDAAVAAKGSAQVRALFFPVFGLWAENDCSPGFKAV